MPVFGLPQHQGTPIWPWIRKLIGDLDRDLQMKVSSWRFLHAGKPVHFAMPDGREISYSGVRFSGSVKTVFWSAFIEPFLLEGAIEVLGKVGIKAEACHVDAKESVTEAAMLLSVVVVRTYRTMAETDSILSGNGVVRGPVRDVSGKIAAMTKAIDEHKSVAILEHVPAAPAKPKSESDEIIQLRPNVHGIGIDLKAVWRRLRKRKKKST